VAQRRDEGTLTIGRAFGFLALGKLLIWSIPPYDLTVMAGDVAFIAAEVVLYALALVLAWRIVGGRATLTDYLPIQLYYSAIFGFIIVFGGRICQSVLKLVDPNLHEYIRNLMKTGDIALYRGEISAPILSVTPIILTGALLATWFVAGWGAYRRLNGASRGRSTIAAVLYLLLAIPGFGMLGLLASALMTDLAARPPG